jgi:uncharacterized protein (DUF302 family)
MIAFDLTRESSLPFPALLAAVQAETAAAGFRVLHVHDVQATLAEKGFQREALAIVEVCNARFAHAVLAADPLVGLMLPCPIQVWERDGRRFVSALRPSSIATFYPDAGIGGVAAEVEAAITGIVERAAADGPA